jgi:hypothetical protein
MYMIKRTRGPSISQKHIDEIYFLTSEGCPCCGEALGGPTLAYAYKTSRSTVSRIRNGTYRTYPLNLDLRGQVRLVKEVKERAKAAREQGVMIGS